MDWIETGYLGLFVATFLSATVIPLSSEVVLGIMVASGFDPWAVLLLATAGNTLGGMSSYGLGYLGNWRAISRYLRVDEQKVYRWKETIDRYGAYAALLCWMPIIGDVIAVGLGIFKANAWRTTFWMTLGKGVRYAVLIWLVLEAGG